MAPQPGMRPQFPTPQINKQQPMSSVGVQGTTQQSPMQQVQQAIQRPGSMPQAQLPTQQVFYDKSGLTQHQILNQHLQQQLQQPVPQQSLGVTPQSQTGHHQMMPSQAHVSVPPSQVGSPMPVQQHQQPVLPGKSG